MASLLNELKPADINAFSLGDDSFYLMMSDIPKESALRMTAMTIEDAVGTSSQPYPVRIDISQHDYGIS